MHCNTLDTLTTNHVQYYPTTTNILLQYTTTRSRKGADYFVQVQLAFGNVGASLADVRIPIHLYQPEKRKK